VLVIWREVAPLWTTANGWRQLWPHLLPLLGVVLLGDPPLLAFCLLLGELVLSVWARLAAFCWCTAQQFESFALDPVACVVTALGLFLPLAGVLAILLIAPGLMAFAPVLALQPASVSLALRWNNPLWLALVPLLWRHGVQGLHDARAWRGLSLSELVKCFQQAVEPVLLRAFLIAALGVYCWLFAAWGNFAILLALLLIAQLLAWADLHPERLRQSRI
jgi:hypothetical protein